MRHIFIHILPDLMILLAAIDAVWRQQAVKKIRAGLFYCFWEASDRLPLWARYEPAHWLELLRFAAFMCHSAYAPDVDPAWGLRLRVEGEIAIGPNEEKVGTVELSYWSKAGSQGLTTNEGILKKQNKPLVKKN